MSYTKGEWKTEEPNLYTKDPIFYYSNINSGGVRIASVFGIGEYCANANARLISASPDLLEACKMALNHLAGDRPCHMAGLIKEKLKQAISKAEVNN